MDRVTGRLRKADRVCRTVVLRLRFSDFSRATRSHTLREPTDRTETVLVAARALLAAAQPTLEQRGITLVGVALSNLEDSGPGQLPLDDRTATLDSTLDELRERFGTEAITRAVLLDREEGPADADCCRTDRAPLRPSGRRPSAHSDMWSAEQNASGMRCSPRWRTSRTRTSPSGSPQWEQTSIESATPRGSSISPASQ